MHLPSLWTKTSNPKDSLVQITKEIFLSISELHSSLEIAPFFSGAQSWQTADDCGKYPKEVVGMIYHPWFFWFTSLLMSLVGSFNRLAYCPLCKWRCKFGARTCFKLILSSKIDFVERRLGRKEERKQGIKVMKRSNQRFEAHTYLILKLFCNVWDWFFF